MTREEYEKELKYVVNGDQEPCKDESCSEKPNNCEDAISRQAVMDALCDGCELFHRNGEQVCLSKCEEYHFLVTLQSVTPKQKMGRWIPVSERFPENIGDYLVTYDYTNFRKDFKNAVGTCWWSGKELGWQCEIYLKVVAWMPLPKPYDESEDTE